MFTRASFRVTNIFTKSSRVKKSLTTLTTTGCSDNEDKKYATIKIKNTQRKLPIDLLEIKKELYQIKKILGVREIRSTLTHKHPFIHSHLILYYLII